MSFHAECKTEMKFLFFLVMFRHRTEIVSRQNLRLRYRRTRLLLKKLSAYYR